VNDPTIAGGMGSNRHSLDEASAARLLQGAVHPDDAPPGYAAVAGLLATAASPAAVDEDAGATTISAMVEAIRGSGPIPETSRRRSMLGKLLAGKALAAVAAVALTAGGAAAATGTLPTPVQGAVSDAVSHIGVDIPHPNHGKSADHRQDGEHRQDGKNDQSGEDQDQPGSTDQADNHGQQTSDAAHDAKTDAKEAGDKVGPAVCAAVGSQCQAEKGNGSGDQGNPPATSGSDDDQGGQRGKSGDDHRRDEDHTTSPTTGSIATGEDHSGRDLPSSGNGKAGNQDN
jgi:hypothetical protein